MVLCLDSTSYVHIYWRGLLISISTTYDHFKRIQRWRELDRLMEVHEACPAPITSSPSLSLYSLSDIKWEKVVEELLELSSDAHWVWTEFLEILSMIKQEC